MKTCSESIQAILTRGGRWRNKQIEAAILESFGLVFQSNTIAKYLSFFINAGQVISAPTRTTTGKMCDEYWWVKNEEKATLQPIKNSFIYVSDTEKLIGECLKIAATYPEEHPELKKIMLQIELLEAKQKRVA